MNERKNFQLSISFYSVMDEDLEDGEIEDDEELVTEPKPPDESLKMTNTNTKSPSSLKKSSDSNNSSSKKASSSKKDKEKGTHEEDDFMSSIESQIANVLKKEGVEPPMPSIKKTELESEQERKSNRRKRRRRKERRDQKRDILLKVRIHFRKKKILRKFQYF